MMNSRLIGLLVACLFVLSCSAYGDDPVLDPAVLEELRTQAVRDWQAIESELRSVDVTYKVTYLDGPRKNMKHIAATTDRVAFDLDRQIALLRTQKEDSPEKMVHRVANSRYNFGVSTPDVSEQGTLLGLKLVSDDSKSETEMPDWVSSRNHLMAATHVSLLRLDELLNLTEFEPIEAVRLTEENEPRIKFSARYLGKKKARRVERAVYTVVLDPLRRHRMLRGEVNVPSVQLITCIVSFHPSEQTHVPQEFVFRIDTGNHRSERTYAYELPKPFTIAEEEFYLPHYGFSERVLETLSPNPWPRWFMVLGGIGSILLGIWFIRRRGRAQAK